MTRKKLSLFEFDYKSGQVGVVIPIWATDLQAAKENIKKVLENGASGSDVLLENRQEATLYLYFSAEDVDNDAYWHDYS